MYFKEKSFWTRPLLKDTPWKNFLKNFYVYTNTIQIKYNFLQFRVKTQLYMLYFKKSSSKDSTNMSKLSQERTAGKPERNSMQRMQKPWK